jgi:hypothetical protein
MRRTSITSKPNITGGILQHEDPRIREFAEEVRREHGGARSVQDENGGFTSMRYNISLGRWERHDGTDWVAA